MRKRAFVTGITGQDGCYLTEFLIRQHYEVHGLVRRSSSFNTARLNHLYRDVHDPSANLILHHGDLLDGSSLRRILSAVQPVEVYNLAAQSHVRVSFDQPEYTADVVGTGALRVLEAVREYAKTSGKSPHYYQAGSSEMFGAAQPPQCEATPFYPRSPYAVAKVAAHWYGINYREAYGLFISNGILFNHESERRGETFVTRKITRALTRIKHGLQEKLFLGNLDSKRDWGYAGDYVEAMWLMLQAEAPGDFVVSTSEAYSVREFLDAAGEVAGIDWKQYVEIDPRYFRPTEVDYLLGDSTRARATLGWKPKVSFKQLVKIMVEHDLELASQEKMLRDAGHKVVLSRG